MASSCVRNSSEGARSAFALISQMRTIKSITAEQIETISAKMVEVLLKSSFLDGKTQKFMEMIAPKMYLTFENLKDVFLFRTPFIQDMGRAFAVNRGTLTYSLNDILEHAEKISQTQLRKHIASELEKRKSYRITLEITDGFTIIETEDGAQPKTHQFNF